MRGRSRAVSAGLGSIFQAGGAGQKELPAKETLEEFKKETEIPVCFSATDPSIALAEFGKAIQQAAARKIMIPTGDTLDSFWSLAEFVRSAKLASKKEVATAEPASADIKSKKSP